MDNYFNKIKYIANTFIIIYNFDLKFDVKILSKYCYKYNIILFNKINIFLKSSCIIYCKNLLN